MEVVPVGPMETPTTSTKNSEKTEKSQKNHITENPQKKYKTSNQPKKLKNIKTPKKRNRYRGKGQKKRKDMLFSVMLINLRGYKSKESSLKKLMKKKRPSILLLNETQMCGKMNVSLPPYTGWSRNRSEKGGGGIASVVAHQYKNSTTQAGEGEGNDEYLITRIECFSPALNIINCYGEQRKTQKEEVEDKWRRLRKEMEEIQAKNEFCLLSGDLNKLVGCGEWGVPDNHPEVSLGGKLLRDLLSTGNWLLVNALGETVVTGGPLTRQDPATGNKSCLDLFVVSADLLPYVDKLVIDSQREMAVARAVKMGKNYKLVYSDHFTCLLTFSNLLKIQDKKEERKKCGILPRRGGGDIMKYSQISIVKH